MHQLVLVTALSATTGLFGGHKSKAKHCGRPARGHCVAAPAPVTHCAPPVIQYAPPASCGAPAPAAPAHHAAPTPQAAVGGYNAFYYPAASSCAGGSCARR